MLRRGGVGAAIALASLGLLAGNAHAGTITIGETTGELPPRYYPIYTASAGEANRVTVERGGQGSVILRDAAGIQLPTPVTRGTMACVKQLDGSVECQNAASQVAPTPYAELSLGDLADAATADIDALIYAGEGDDTLTTNASTELHGDGGDDTFHTGFWLNWVYGGDGDDVQYVEEHGYPPEPLTPKFNSFRGEAGDDREVDLSRVGGQFKFLGGSGADSFVPDDSPFDNDYLNWTYNEDGRTSGVKVIPDGFANDGAPGEGDNVPTTIRLGLTGTEFADDLTESPTAAGGVDGMGGDDTLRGAHPVSNSFNGYAGNDRILVADGARDHVLCGPGGDRVKADAVDVLGSPSECESISYE